MKSRWEHAMDAEIRFHLENLVRDLMASGISRAEAERKARQQFGSLELAKDECRETRPLEWVRSIVKDFHLALRNMRRAPGFSITAIATLAIGIGANTTVLSVAASQLAVS